MTATPLAVALEGATHTEDDLGVAVAGDYGDVAAEYGALVHEAALVDRSARGTVRVHGPDAGSFLQSLVSQDLAPLADGEGCRSLLLQPQGKLLADFRVLRVGPDEWWLDTEIGRGADLAGQLERYCLRVKVEVSDTSTERAVLSVTGPAGASVAGAVLGVDLPEHPHSHRSWRRCRAVRAWPLPGVDLVGPLVEIDAAWRLLRDAGVPPAGLAACEAVRVEAGLPRQGYELDESTIPQEAFLETTAVSFTKGCFVGQELVCRIDTRGHVNRFLRGLDVEGDARPPRGAEVIVDDRPAGQVTSSAYSPARGVVALGYVRREVDPPADAILRWPAGAATARVVALPARG